MEASSPPKGSGWVAFAGTLFLLLGVFNLIDGVIALAEDDHFISDELFFGDLSTWGVIFLVIGGLQLIAGIRIFSGKGQILGVFLASLNFVAQLFFIGAYPVW